MAYCWFMRKVGVDNAADESALEAFCDEHYDDAYMSQRFQTMSIDVDSASRVG